VLRRFSANRSRLNFSGPAILGQTVVRLDGVAQAHPRVFEMPIGQHGVGDYLATADQARTTAPCRPQWIT